MTSRTRTPPKKTRLTPKAKPLKAKPKRRPVASPRRLPKKPLTQLDGYELHKLRVQQREMVQSAKGRDIGSIRPIKDIERRLAARASLEQFCLTYNPRPFYRPFSNDHRGAIRRLEETARAAGLYAYAMPRGSGKSILCRMASLYAVSYVFQRYSFIIGANSSKAEDNLAALKTCIRFLPQYRADFPEIAQAVESLSGIAQKAGGQLCCGESTMIEWSQDRIILPTVPPPPNWPKGWPLRDDGKVPTSGSIVASAGLTSDGIRGSVITLATGESLRPDYVLLDDPQTPESAMSPTQIATRLRLINEDLLGLAGPGETISCVMPCTVIAPGDVADQMLDRKRNPLWRGQRTRLMNAMPTNMKAWDRYFDVFKECAQAEPPDIDPAAYDDPTAAEVKVLRQIYKMANDYYCEHRAELDEGATPAWPERMGKWETSATQHAMHLYFRDQRAFWSNYQNDPKPVEITGAESRQLAEKDLAAKFNNLTRGIVPRECNRLTAFVDVQGEILFWAVCGWTDRFGGALVDYGTFPPQPVAAFEALMPRAPLSAMFPRLERTARIYAGLAELVPQIMGRSYLQDGADGRMSVSLCLIDAGFEADAVHDFLSRSPLKAVLKPSKGKAVDAGSKPMNEYRKDVGDIMGWNWRIDAKSQAKGRFVSFDTYAWKSFFAESLLAPAGASGSFYLPGGTLQEHPLLTMHLLAEYREPTWGLGRRVEKWMPRPNRRENHWWDCCVGAAVAASVLGVNFNPGAAAGAGPLATQTAGPPVKLSEMPRRRIVSEGRRRAM